MQPVTKPPSTNLHRPKKHSKGAQTTNAPKKTHGTNVVLIGTKIGRCDICKATKKILILKYGFNLCEECLSICTSILEQLQAQPKS